MQRSRINLTVTHGIDGGTNVQIDFLDVTPGLDAIAAIRALVDRTAQLTRLSPERILGMVEKASYSRDGGLLVKA